MIFGVSKVDMGVSVMDAREERLRSKGCRSRRSEDEVSDVPVVKRQNRTIASHNL